MRRIEKYEMNSKKGYRLWEGFRGTLLAGFTESKKEAEDWLTTDPFPEDSQENTREAIDDSPIKAELEATK